ncbi:MAG: HesA/MoeB/ThiF family protein [Armatimonadota bacterium]
MPELTEWELEKYKRQIMIPGFGVEAQEKLKGCAALVTRVGGLGGPTALYLAAAGIGKLLIAHGGTVTPSNLNRMILVRGDGVDQPRMPQMVETLRRFTPDVEVIGIAEDARADNVAGWIEQVDIVCPTTPDFGERLLLNAEAWRQGKPLIDAWMSGMEAQLTTLIPGQTACLQCRLPEKPDWWHPLGFGVVGALSASLGCLAALEAIKVLTGYGETLAGKLLVMDAEEMEFHKYEITRREGCPVCGG